MNTKTRYRLSVSRELTSDQVVQLGFALTRERHHMKLAKGPIARFRVLRRILHIHDLLSGRTVWNSEERSFVKDYNGWPIPYFCRTYFSVVIAYFDTPSRQIGDTFADAMLAERERNGTQ